MQPVVTYGQIEVRQDVLPILFQHLLELTNRFAKRSAVGEPNGASVPKVFRKTILGVRAGDGPPRSTSQISERAQPPENLRTGRICRWPLSGFGKHSQAVLQLLRQRAIRIVAV